MNDLKKQYNQILFERKRLVEQIKDLEKNTKIKKYLKLCSQNDKLAIRQNDLYKQIKVDEYSLCNHIWVNTFHDYDSWEGRSYDYYGCIKCGLDESVFHLMESCCSLDCFSLDQRIMYDFMRNNQYGRGICIKILCDLDLAKNIYSKIKETYPDIDNETARRYFEIALEKIKNSEINNEKNQNGVKR